MIVMKFGGSSVDSPNKIKTIEEIVRRELARKPIIVVSALRGVTSELHELARTSYQGTYPSTGYVALRHYELIRNLGLDLSISPEISELGDCLKTRNLPHLQYIDQVMSLGERISIKIVAAYLRSKGLNAQAFNSYDLGLVTNSNFSSAEFLPESLPAINSSISSLDCIPIITGFIAKDKKANITTPGRNKSDYSAAIFARAIEAEELQIWTDVNGILTANPEIVPSARTIANLSYAEAKELAFFGAKVLHPNAIEPAEERNIPIRVLNTLDRNNPGSTISIKSPRNGVKGITSKSNVIIVNNRSGSMIDSHGHLADTFNSFSKYGKSVDAVATSNITISGTVYDWQKLEEIIKEISQRGKVTLYQGLCQICVVGDGIDETPGIQGRVFGTLPDIIVKMISQAADSSNITFLVDADHEHEVVRRLHREFIENYPI